MGKSSPPRPPDPQETAGAQTANNIGTSVANAWLGNVNQVTPYGDLTYSQTGTFQYTDPNTGEVYDIPNFTATQTLSPEMQAIFDQQTRAQSNLATMGADQSARLMDHLSTNLNFDDLPEGGSAANLERGPMVMNVPSQADEIQTSIDPRTGQLVRNVDQQSYQQDFADVGGPTRTYGTDFSEDRRRVEDAIYSRMNPQLERDRENLRSSLVSQGIREGSTAYDRAMNRFGEQSNDARMGAILAGGQEQSRMAGLERDRAGFENAAQSQAYQQAMGRAGFTNDARFRQLQSDIMGGQFANQATGQAFSQDLGAGQFRNAAIGQQFQQNLASGSFANSAQNQGFNQSLTTQDRMDRDRAIARDETLTLRNQPINEIAALLGTGQVTQPNFVSTQMPSIPTVDRAGLEQQNYASRLNAYNQRQATMGGIFGTLGNVAAAGIGGGFF